MQSWIGRAGEGRMIALPPLGITMTVRVPAAATGGAFCVIEERTEPGHGPPLHVHARQSETFRWLEGDYVLQVGDRTERVGPGTVAVVPPGVPHTFRNVGAVPGRLQFTLTPAEEGELFFDALAEILSGGPPSAERLAPLVDRFGFVIVGPPLAP